MMTKYMHDRHDIIIFCDEERHQTRSAFINSGRCVSESGSISTHHLFVFKSRVARRQYDRIDSDRSGEVDTG